MDDDALLDEQTAYYQARAAEYDEWFLRTGRYDRGEKHRRKWNAELDTVRKALEQSAPFGEALEIACGTGLWTNTLAAGADTLTAIDSVAETIAINRRKNPDAGIDYHVVDAFEEQPENAFDFVFFGFWLSHVTASRFDPFWKSLTHCLRPSGRVFFLDSLKAQRSTANDHHALDDSGIVIRQVNSGAEFRIVKNFYQPESLLARLADLGWNGSIETSGEFFLYGCLAV